MKSIVKISDLPNVLSVDELLEVKGGLVDNNTLCSLFGAAVKCSTTGSGICTVEGSGICSVEGSGVIIKHPEPEPDPSGPIH